jgi:hypothetical protein
MPQNDNGKMGTVPARFIRHINAGLTDIRTSSHTLRVRVDCPHFSESHYDQVHIEIRKTA